MAGRIRTTVWLLTAVVCCPVTAADERSGAERPDAGRSDDERPNIVLIFADDLGWRDVGYQSDGVFQTPRIDRMAREGMVFTDAYATAGNCAPSRACLMSGSYTPRHHLYAVGSTNRGPNAMMRLIPVPNRNGLGSDFVTAAEALRAAGYATGHFGKWHLHGRDGARPSDQGFDETFDSFGDGELAEGTETNRKGPPEDPKGVFTLTRKACAFIEAHRDRPFFCYLAHHAIHTPLQTRDETRQRMADQSGDNLPSVEYRGCTYDLDASVGLLLDRLKELDLDSRTLVIFTSDNGATQRSSQEPLRGNKGCYYEGGIREPLIARWPGVIPAGTQCAVPVSNIDFYPTFLDVADAPAPETARLDGESLLPLFTRSGDLHRTALFWHFPGYLDRPVNRGRDPVFRTRPVSVIRKGDWKLHLYHEEWQLDGGRSRVTANNSVELYNLAEDIGERHNLVTSHPEQRDDLLDDLLAWFEHTDAVLPTEANPDYDPEAKPRRRRNRR